MSRNRFSILTGTSPFLIYETYIPRRHGNAQTGSQHFVWSLSMLVHLSPAAACSCVRQYASDLRPQLYPVPLTRPVHLRLLFAGGHTRAFTSHSTFARPPAR